MAVFALNNINIVVASVPFQIPIGFLRNESMGITASMDRVMELNRENLFLQGGVGQHKRKFSWYVVNSKTLDISLVYTTQNRYILYSLQAALESLMYLQNMDSFDKYFDYVSYFGRSVYMEYGLLRGVSMEHDMNGNTIGLNIQFDRYAPLLTNGVGAISKGTVAL